MQHRHAIRQPLGFVEIVCRHKIDSPRAAVVEQRAHAAGISGSSRTLAPSEAGCGFVQQRPGSADFLPHARQLGGAVESRCAARTARAHDR